jgi:hypothetical protein
MGFTKNDVLVFVHGIVQKLFLLDFFMKAIIFVFLDEKVSGLFLELICDNSQIAQIEGRLVE